MVVDMMIARVKQNAKRALAGNWGKAIAILFIMGAVCLLFAFFETLFYWIYDFTGGTGPTFELSGAIANFPLLASPGKINLVPFLISTLSMICALLVLSPLSLGVTQWYYKTVSGEPVGVSLIFSFFSHGKLYFKSVWYHIQITVRAFLWGILLFAPGLTLFALCNYFLEHPAEGIETVALSIGLVLAVLLIVLCAVVLMLVLFRYFLAPYYLVDNPELTVTQAIRLSIKGTKEQKGDLFLFVLSFLPWMLLGILLLPLLYVLPYYLASKSLYAKVLITRQSREQDLQGQGLHEEEQVPKEGLSPDGGKGPDDGDSRG